MDDCIQREKHNDTRRDTHKCATTERGRVDRENSLKKSLNLYVIITLVFAAYSTQVANSILHPPSCTSEVRYLLARQRRKARVKAPSWRCFFCGACQRLPRVQRIHGPGKGRRGNTKQTLSRYSSMMCTSSSCRRVWKSQIKKKGAALGI